jgi:hypothetical protein
VTTSGCCSIRYDEDETDATHGSGVVVESTASVRKGNSPMNISGLLRGKEIVSMTADDDDRLVRGKKILTSEPELPPGGTSM